MRFHSYSTSGKKTDEDDEQLYESGLKIESFGNDADLIDQETEAELNPVEDGAEHDIGRIGSYFHRGDLSVVRP